LGLVVRRRCTFGQVRSKVSIFGCRFPQARRAPARTGLMVGFQDSATARGRQWCAVLLQISLALSLQGVAPQPNATNHTPTPPPGPHEPAETRDWHTWFQDQTHQFFISSGAVAFVLLAACVVMLVRDRRRRRDDYDDYSDPSEPLWSPQGAE